METVGVQFVIGEREANEISAYCQIAKVNRSILTLGEVLEVTSISATEEDVEAAWETNSVLSSKYSLDAGWIIEKSPEPGHPSDRTSSERKNRQRSSDNLRAARELAAVCAGDNLRLIAVSGGNSYRSARPNDDIDFFSVTANNSVWIFMLKVLIVARLHCIGKKVRTPFCFSYVVEERRVRRDFGTPKDGLFARDALMAHVLSGATYYHSLISQSKWMEGYFPKLYRRRAEAPIEAESAHVDKEGSAVLNSFLFYTLGTYVRLKAFLLNRKFAKTGNSPALFRAELSKDRCLYESNRYRRLRGMYPQPVAEVPP